MPRPRALSARQFFEDLCPVLLRADYPRPGWRGSGEPLGAFAFQITGEDGGEWTLYFDRAEVCAGADVLAARGFLRTPSEVLERWLVGNLDVARAFDDGLIEFAGSTEALQVLAALFRATASVKTK
jgi:hypothetical protein